MCAGILHCDLSLGNIMYRVIKQKNEAGIVEKKVCGVLTDFDLSSWTKATGGDNTKTSQQRIGTFPYMAHELLEDSDAPHLYRHDLESLFYIILAVAARYEIQAPEEGREGGMRMRDGELPYQMWFDRRSWKILARFKRPFLFSGGDLRLSPAFEDFEDWLEDFRYAFGEGFRSKVDHRRELARRLRHRDEGSEVEVVPAPDEETLGGHVQYSALIDPVRRLKGKLEGLIIRYDPSIQT